MNGKTANSDDISAVEDVVAVSRETAARLQSFVAILGKWQAHDNLIASSTLPMLWRRHVADSAQLARFFPQARIWLDLGSGAGFPGLVLAIFLADFPDSCVHMVESNQRKCAFLREVIRAIDLPAKVHHGRIEAILAEWNEPVDVISARALAPLDRLFSLIEPMFSSDVVGAFHKGQDFEREIEETTKSWAYDLIKHKSLTDKNSAILEIRNLARKEHETNGFRGRS